MFLEKIKSDGLAHLSYILGDGSEAVVIDPRWDCQVYVDVAAKHGMQILRIFETHRNEDYVVGSMELSRRTGAVVHHGKQLAFGYGEGVSEGDTFTLGDLRLEILETPGHTDESISIVVRDTNFGEAPVAVFTGDALFVGDVGRTDFYPGRAEEVAGALYDSIFHKLLPLGDQTILLPAHGAGSVCGGGIASRELSTLGHERLSNPALQRRDRGEFIEYKVNEHHYMPPYFRKMEEYNQHGPPAMPLLSAPPPMTADAVARAQRGGALLVDLRSPEAYAGACVPGSLAIPLEMVSAYAGYLIDYDTDIILIPETAEQIPAAVRYFIRMGYDTIKGYLKGGLHSWAVAGFPFDRIGAVHAEALSERLRSDERLTLLDVRRISEYKSQRLKEATHIFLGDLPDRLDEVERGAPVITFCGSGRRAIIAASILKRNGFERVEDSLGSMQACEKTNCETVSG